MPSCHGPGLGKGAMRNGKEQHRRGSHGGDHCRASSTREYQAGDTNQRQKCQPATEGGDELFSKADLNDLDAEPFSQCGNGHGGLGGVLLCGDDQIAAHHGKVSREGTNIGIPAGRGRGEDDGIAFSASEHFGMGYDLVFVGFWNVIRSHCGGGGGGEG